MELVPVVNLVSIAEFDENHSTILLNLVVTLYWKDTRIALKSNKPDEEVNFLGRIHAIPKEDSI